MVFVVMVTVLVMGLAKAIDINGFLSALSTWSLLPARSHLWIAAALPAIEVFVSGAWLLRIWRNFALIATFVLLSLFTIAYSVQASVRLPDCGCMGLLSAMTELRQSAYLVIGRNLLLMALLSLGLALLGNKNPVTRKTWQEWRKS